jgi:hypothetical protein
MDVVSPLGKALLGTYAGHLAKSYCVRPIILPFRYTTLPDFLNFWERNTQAYDAVIVHCGIVDFSPRPLSTIARMKADKLSAPGYADLFRLNAGHHNNADGAPYEGEPTTTLYSPRYLEDVIIPKLTSIKKLLWVSSSPFVPGWEGNYTRGRPIDIATRVASFEAVMRASPVHVVNLQSWSVSDVQRYTIDNVHFSPSGFDAVAAILRAELARFDILPTESNDRTPPP